MSDENASYEIITKEIKACQRKLERLTEKRKQICPHKHITRDSHITDTDVFLNAQTWSITYKCLDCGLSACGFKGPSENTSADEYYRALENEFNTKEEYITLEKTYEENFNKKHK